MRLLLRNWQSSNFYQRTLATNSTMRGREPSRSPPDGVTLRSNSSLEQFRLWSNSSLARQKTQSSFQRPARAGPSLVWVCFLSFFLPKRRCSCATMMRLRQAVCMTCWKLSCWTCGENEGVHAQSAPRRRRRRQHRKLDGTSYSPPARCLLLRPYKAWHSDHRSSRCPCQLPQV